MNVLDLFSGIGGFSLGLERAGMRTVAFCEIDPFCRKILAKNFPGVPCYDDVRTLTSDRLRADGIAAEVICGGFPCQDISSAGKGAGIAEGTRSGLWAEYARIIGELRPRFIIVENVAALLGRGLDKVLGDLAALGYDTEWHCIPASAIGAPHRRDRIWIVANPMRAGAGILSQSLAEEIQGEGITGHQSALQTECCSQDVAYANSNHKLGRRSIVQMGWGRIALQIANDGEFGRTQWGAEPDVGRVAHGIPSRMDRLRGLGNAVVPQIPEIIGRAIMSVNKGT